MPKCGSNVFRPKYNYLPSKLIDRSLIPSCSRLASIHATATIQYSGQHSVQTTTWVKPPNQTAITRPRDTGRSPNRLLNAQQPPYSLQTRKAANITCKQVMYQYLFDPGASRPGPRPQIDRFRQYVSKLVHFWNVRKTTTLTRCPIKVGGVTKWRNMHSSTKL